MSDNPTVFEDRPANGETRREIPADATRRESAGQGRDAATRRESDGRGSPQQSRRLNIPPSVAEEYDYLHDLAASGGEADIALLQHRQTGDQVIFKYYKPGMAPDPVAMLMLRNADASHIVHLIDFHDRPDGTWELQEYCSLGSMRDWVAKQGGKLNKDVLRDAVREIEEALKYLHSLGSGIAHRDLKPANVLVRSDQPLDLVLADFGLAKAQQAITHLTTTVKGTWHYAAPEVHSKQSSSKSDWFSLGAMVYEFYTGRKLFAMADGTEVGEDDAKARCLSRNYSADLVDDPRWKLLIDGLLTWDKDHRWGSAEVDQWLKGKSPKVYNESVQAQPVSHRGVGYRPNWSPILVNSPEELAQQFRLNWDEAANELAGRPDAKMIHFLENFPGMENAVRIIGSSEAPGPKLVRLQAILDPDGPIHFEGTPLDDTSISQRIQTADKGDEKALDWLTSILNEHILTAFAEVTGSQQAAHADYLLGQWKDQADTTTRPLPSDYQALAREAFRTALPELFAAALKQAGAA
jgi:serine/threonine protein kinase